MGFCIGSKTVFFPRSVLGEVLSYETRNLRNKVVQPLSSHAFPDGAPQLRNYLVRTLEHSLGFTILLLASPDYGIANRVSHFILLA